MCVGLGQRLGRLRGASAAPDYMSARAAAARAGRDMTAEPAPASLGQRQKRTAGPRPVRPRPGLARASHEAAALRVRLPRAGRRQARQRCPAARMDRLRPPRQPPRPSPRCPPPCSADTDACTLVEGSRGPGTRRRRGSDRALGPRRGLGAASQAASGGDAGPAAARVAAAQLAALAPPRLLAAPAGATATRCLPVPRSAAKGYSPLPRACVCQYSPGPPSAERRGGDRG